MYKEQWKNKVVSARKTNNQEPLGRSEFYLEDEKYII